MRNITFSCNMLGLFIVTDVIGVCKTFEVLKTVFSKRTNKELKIREITIVDESKAAVRIHYNSIIEKAWAIYHSISVGVVCGQHDDLPAMVLYLNKFFLILVQNQSHTLTKNFFLSGLGQKFIITVIFSHVPNHGVLFIILIIIFSV